MTNRRVRKRFKWFTNHSFHLSGHSLVPLRPDNWGHNCSHVCQPTAVILSCVYMQGYVACCDHLQQEGKGMGWRESNQAIKCFLILCCSYAMDDGVPPQADRIAVAIPDTSQSLPSDCFGPFTIMGWVWVQTNVVVLPCQCSVERVKLFHWATVAPYGYDDNSWCNCVHLIIEDKSSLLVGMNWLISTLRLFKLSKAAQWAIRPAVTS